MFLFVFSVSAEELIDGTLGLDTDEAYASQKVGVTLENLEEGYEVTAYLESEGNDTLTVSIKDLFTNPYFVVPESAKVGETYIVKKYEIRDTYLGDVDKDGEITEEDKDLISNAAKGLVVLDTDQIKRADLDKDGKVTTSDWTTITALLNGMITVKDAPFTLSYNNTSTSNKLTIIENPNYYTISLSTGDDEETTIKVCPTCDDFKDIVLPTPEKENYEFDGWYADSDLTIKVSSLKDDWDKIIEANSKSENKNIKLYSKWKEVSSVEVDNTGKNTSVALVFVAILSAIVGFVILSINSRRKINNQI